MSHSQNLIKRLCLSTSTIGLFAVVTIGALPALADCTSPASPEGGLAYFTADDTYRLCDGNDDWVTLYSSANAGALDDLSDVITEYAAHYNMYLGSSAGVTSSAGAVQNLALGQNALNSIDSATCDASADTTCDSNLAIGYNAATAITTGARNIALGGSALSGNTTQTDNIAIGESAMTGALTSSNNIAIGRRALRTNTGGGNIAIGSAALGSNSGGDAYRNVGVGYAVGLSLTTSTDNVGVGYEAMKSTSTASSNVALGAIALHEAKAISRNVAVGNAAMQYANDTTTAADTYNVAVGYRALYGSTTAANNTGVENTALGALAIAGTTSGSNNVAVGYSALTANTDGTRNVAVGHSAMVAEVSGYENVAVGTSALSSSNGGYQNTAIGDGAMAAITTGFDNVAIGANALYNATGENNTAIGYAAGDNITTGGYNIIIGSSVDAPSATASSQLNIGDLITGTLGSGLVTIEGTGALTVPSGTQAQRPTAVNGMIRYDTDDADFEVYENGAWVDISAAVSDRRLKDDITPLDGAEVLSRLEQINTYSFTMKDEKNKRTHYGVIAQELEDIFPELVDTSSDENHIKSVHYEELIAPMIEATKTLRAENVALKSQMDDMKTAQADTMKSLEDIKEQVALLNKVTGSKVGKASLQPYIMLLLGLLFGIGGMAFWQRRNKA